MALTITRRVHFCAGHRLVGHEGKCAHFHGHSYVAEFTIVPLEPDALDDVGRVIDFAVLKSELKGWIDEHWDHGFVLWREDANGITAMDVVEPSKVYLLDENPTAENMARHLFDEVCPQLLAPLGVRALRVSLRESDDTWATVE